MIENWTKFEPINGLSNKYYLESIIDDLEEFKIILVDINDCKKKVSIVIDSFLGSYHITDVVYLDKKYELNFYQEWTFFKLDNSDYIDWLSEESWGLAEDFYSLMHFAFICSNSKIDIACSAEPRFEFYEN